MRFPKTEPEIIALAQQIENGLNTNANLADSPVDKAVFASKLAGYLAKRNEILTLSAELGTKHIEKDDLQEDLTESMQRVIGYLESKTNNDPEQLATIGWIVDAVSGAKQPPGQPRALEIVRQTDGSIFLDWKNPTDGGRVASYRVERRERPAGAWETVSATNLTELLLINQPRGKELEYRIVAFNSNGDSTPSNTVAAVL
ncbi:MAG: fibronectin type III domain-containing protein [Pyrinomonadaceae bacterium]|nr:fibronectin type III domain-containing protein [Pyrinomonadaceae bacterium]